MSLIINPKDNKKPVYRNINYNLLRDFTSCMFNVVRARQSQSYEFQLSLPHQSIDSGSSISFYNSRNGREIGNAEFTLFDGGILKVLLKFRGEINIAECIERSTEIFYELHLRYRAPIQKSPLRSKSPDMEIYLKIRGSKGHGGQGRGEENEDSGLEDLQAPSDKELKRLERLERLEKGALF